VSRLSVLVEPAKTADERTARAWRKPQWLILLCYLLAAIGLTYHLWAHPPASIPSSGTGVQPDILLNLWFMRDIATAVSHGSFPALVTTALNWPQGVNLMWNTSLLLPGVLLAPVTMLAGPATSLIVLMVLGFAGSAASMFVVLRRWGASISAAAIGGAFFGFSPAMRMAAVDHYHLQFVVLPPLIVDAALCLLTGRGRPVRTGIGLGLLVAAQIFIAEEMLVDTVLAGLLIAAVLAISQRSKILARIRPSAGGLGIAIAVVLLICGRALWVQFIGPLAESGSPWHVAKFGNALGNFVAAPNGMVLHGHGAASGQVSVEYFGYLGWPLLVVLLAAAIYFWRDVRIRVAAVTFFLLELLSLGGHTTSVGPWHLPGAALPWHLLAQVPLLSQALPNRLSILADGAAAVVLALAIDQTRAALPARQWLKPAVLVAGALVLVPALPLAVPAMSVGRPSADWKTVIANLDLPVGAPVLVLPESPRAGAMPAQAITGERISVVGGFCIAPAPASNAAHLSPGSAAECDAVGTLNQDQQTTQLRMSKLAAGQNVKPARETMALALTAWRPAAVITSVGGNNLLGRYLLGFLGRPTAHDGAVLGWRIDPAALHVLAQKYGG
jgi:hypothetical protein